MTIDHPSERNEDDGFIETFTGRQFWPLNPRPEDIDILDIAHALAHQCRYTGHTSHFWSVAMHSVWVAALVPPEFKLWALLHDASEAYLSDLARPIKRAKGGQLGAAYREVEENLMRAVAEAFGLPWPEPPIVKLADGAMLWHEASALMPKPLKPWWYSWREYADQFPGVEVRIQNHDPQTAKTVFLKTFEDIYSDGTNGKPVFCGQRWWILP